MLYCCRRGGATTIYVSEIIAEFYTTYFYTCHSSRGNDIQANGKLVSFGGHFFSGNDKFEYLNETWLLDVEKLLWYPVNCSGELPGPRYGHSAHVLGSRMFIFGGKGPGDTVYKDVYFLDLLEWVWVPVNSISTPPAAR